MAEGNELATLAVLSVDELLLRLVDETTGLGGPADDQHKRRMGEALFRYWFSEVRESVCGTLSETLSHSPEDTEGVVRDAAAVMDLMQGLQGRVPVATMAVLVVKYSLSLLCMGTGGATQG